MTYVRFKCAHCAKQYETEFKPDLDLSFICECDTPLTVKVLPVEQRDDDEPTIV